MLTGGCRCGAVRYEAGGDPVHHALCHCADCRASSGAPAVAWIAVPAPAFRVTQGEARSYNGSGESIRYFCGTCGTGLYFINDAMLPGIVDIQSATLDDTGRHAPGAQIQVAERLGWMADLNDLPCFDRYPG